MSARQIDSLDDDEKQQEITASTAHSDSRPRTAASAAVNAPPSDGGQNIKVMCRFRPENAQELREGGSTDTLVEFVSDSTVNVTLDGKPSSFTFDRVFPPEASQADVYDAIGTDTVSSILEGFNAAVLSYGQSGAGKTHSMLGSGYDNRAGLDASVAASATSAASAFGCSDRDPGLIPRILGDLFSQISALESDTVQFVLRASYLEIYMETISDLLNPLANNRGGYPQDPSKRGKSLEVRQDAQKGMLLPEATEVPLYSLADVFETLRLGARNRRVASTKANDQSSRSHAILLVTLQRRSGLAGRNNSGGGGGQTVKTSQLYLADLAGSEKVEKSEVTGINLVEANLINKGLLALGQVIQALTSSSSSSSSASSASTAHVPFRNSRLTRLLSNCIGGNSRTTLLIATSPARFNMKESLSTLRFGARMKQIKNRAIINVEMSYSEVKRLYKASQEENAELKQKLKQMENQIKLMQAVQHYDITAMTTAANITAASVPGSAATATPAATSLDHDHHQRKRHQQELEDAAAAAAEDEEIMQWQRERDLKFGDAAGFAAPASPRSARSVSSPRPSPSSAFSSTSASSSSPPSSSSASPSTSPDSATSLVDASSSAGSPRGGQQQPTDDSSTTSDDNAGRVLDFSSDSSSAIQKASDEDEKFPSSSPSSQRTKIVMHSTSVAPNSLFQSPQALRIALAREVSSMPRCLELTPSSLRSSSSGADLRQLLLHFLCPLTKQVMRDPVVALDGHTYERRAISAFFLNARSQAATSASTASSAGGVGVAPASSSSSLLGISVVSPVTGQVMSSRFLVPNVALAAQIRHFYPEALSRQRRAAAARGMLEVSSALDGEAGYDPPFLSVLPLAVLSYLCELLDVRALVRLSRCNRELSSVAAEPRLWKRLILANGWPLHMEQVRRLQRGDSENGQQQQSHPSNDLSEAAAASSSGMVMSVGVSAGLSEATALKLYYKVHFKERCPVSKAEMERRRIKEAAWRGVYLAAPPTATARTLR